MNPCIGEGATHNACPCVLERMAKLERVAEAAKEIYKIVMMAKAHKPIGLQAKSINLLALGEALAALDEDKGRRS